MSDATDFVVDRSDLHRTAFVPGRDSGASVLAAGQVLVHVDRFAITANNITYGAVGDMIGYWNFFPAHEGWGRIPVWGFADVVRSSLDAIPAGERLYGYFPISTHLVLAPEQVSPAGFVDGLPHRAALPPIYNNYTRVAADPAYDRTREPALALFRPLFTTSFLLDDLLQDEKFFGARSVVLSSASSKTALGLAFLLSRADRPRPGVVGLTSAGNAKFVEATGYYDRVLTYDAIGSLAAEPTVLVDFAGNAAVVAGVHRHLGDRLTYSCRVGITHWDKLASAEPPPGPTPVFFFAPDQARKRIADWGMGPFQARVGEAMGQFLRSTSPWLRVVEERGPQAIEAVYRSFLDGRADPAVGHVLAL